jgi:hypothetical protein
MSSAKDPFFKFNFEAEQPMKETIESDHRISVVSPVKN